MITCLEKEILLRSGQKNIPEGIPFFSPEVKIKTIYFGGGTPSLLAPEEINRLLQAVRKNYQMIPDPEITLEANPDDITAAMLTAWREMGINRLSIGIQSFLDRDLQWMNRSHDAARALQSISLAREAGFYNFSIDLIFGMPELSDKEWEQNIEKAVQLHIPHIACYALTVEPSTALARMIELGKKEPVDNDVQATQFKMLMQALQKAGYEHYEISNFALPGHRSKHNSSYWQQEKYLGIGPSAHSYNGTARMWNIANNVTYMKSIEQGEIPLEKEILTPAQRLNEYIMTSLRTMEGMDLQTIEHKYSADERRRIEKLLEKIPKNLWILDGSIIKLTDEGKLFADGIASDLFK